MQYPGVIIPVGKADREMDKNELASPDMKRPCESPSQCISPWKRLTFVQIVRMMRMAHPPAFSLSGGELMRSFLRRPQ